MHWLLTFMLRMSEIKIKSFTNFLVKNTYIKHLENFASERAS